MLTKSIEFFGSDLADARVRTGDNGSFSIQPGLTLALTAEHNFHSAVHLYTYYIILYTCTSKKYLHTWVNTTFSYVNYVYDDLYIKVQSVSQT